MSRHAFRLSTPHRLALAGSLGLSFLSGVAWWLLHRSGLERHPAGGWLLRVHGAGAFATLVVLGSLLPTHVRAAWLARRNRRTGLLLIGLVSLQVLTGYGLYYSDEPLRALASLGHLILGLGLPALLVLHIVAGRRRARRRTLELEPAPYFASPVRARARESPVR